MAYQVPQVRVFQEVAVAPSSVANTRAAHITGPHAWLVRYANAAERLIGSLGTYTGGDELVASWPDRPAGATVDQDYTALFAEDGLLEYYTNLIGVGSGVASDADYPNRVRDAATSFADNGDDYPMSAAMGDRGAKAGDTVYVRGTSGGDEYELWTRIRSFLGDPTAAAVGAAAAVSTNQEATTYLINTATLGLINAVTFFADGSAYDGRIDGVIDETYTITVTSGSVGGDFTTARLRVESDSGLDDDSGVIPAAAGGYTPIGSRGLQIVLDLNETASASSAAEEGGISDEDLAPGQIWSVRVRQAFTPPTATSGGTYVGLETTTYIVEVTKGGTWAEEPEVSVSTTTGYDAAGPVVVTGPATDVDVGGYGVLIQFDETGLRKGDKYTVLATASAEGPLRTIILADDLPTALVGATDLDLRLYIKDDFEIDRYRPDDLSIENWTPETTQITVADAVTVAHADWTVDGAVVPLTLASAELFVQYRAWLETYVTSVGSVDTAEEVEDTLGPVVPDNPLAWGVYMAALNSGGARVFFTAVAEPEDDDSWAGALRLTEGVEDIYNVVPLSSDTTIQDLWAAHANAQSAAAVGNWRATVLAVEVGTVGVVASAANSTDGGVILATLADDPTVSGTQYTRLSVPAGNAAFETNGVRSGDTVRFLFGVDGAGRTTYTEFTVDEVISEGTLTLLTGHDVAIPVASKVEIWRTYTAADHTTLITSQVSRFNDWRVVMIANPTLEGGGYTFAGYFGAAAVAGLRSGAAPHRPLTNVALTGVTGMGTIAAALGGSQLDAVAEQGAWWIYRDRNGNVYNRHGLTTDMSSLGRREESLRSNFDAISRSFRTAYLPYIGQVTVTDQLLSRLKYEFENVAATLTGITYGDLGPQMIGYDNLVIRQDAVERDRVTIAADITVPAPLNYLDLYLNLFI